MFRARAADGSNLTGRRFTLATSNAALATVAPFGSSTTTDNAGRGEFVVTLTAAAVAGDIIDITVTIDGKSTVWRVTVN
jgi:3D (Asp-Asp-Asp) domain-containing protein